MEHIRGLLDYFWAISHAFVQWNKAYFICFSCFTLQTTMQKLTGKLTDIYDRLCKKIFLKVLLAIRIKYILWANLQAKTLSSCAYYVLIRSCPVRGPLQPLIRSTGQDFYNLLLCCCSNKGHKIVLLCICILSWCSLLLSWMTSVM
jgi:hypothetical protein